MLTRAILARWQQLLSGSYDNTARLWDLATGKHVQELKGHSWWVWAAEFSPDAQRIVTAGQDGKAIVWRRKLSSSSSHRARRRRSPADSRQPPADSHLYAYAHRIHRPRRRRLHGHASRPRAKLVATGGYDKLVMIWNPDEVKPVDIGTRLDGDAGTESELPAIGRARRARALGRLFARTASSCSAAARTTRSACGMSPPAKP